jgi:hypothetical protein
VSFLKQIVRCWPYVLIVISLSGLAYKFLVLLVSPERTSSEDSSHLDGLPRNERHAFGPCDAIGSATMGAKSDGTHVWQVHVFLWVG